MYFDDEKTGARGALGDPRVGGREGVSFRRRGDDGSSQLVGLGRLLMDVFRGCIRICFVFPVDTAHRTSRYGRAFLSEV